MRRWKPARTLYLVLAIMLTFSVIPFIPFSINMTLARQGTLSLFNIIFLMYDIIGLLIALTLLGRVRRDHYKPIGALLGFVTYALALVGHFLFYRYREETLYFSDFFQAPAADEIFRVIVIVAIVTWIFNVLALIMCYVEVFNLREKLRTRRQATAHKTATTETRKVAATHDAHKQINHDKAGIVAHGHTGHGRDKKTEKGKRDKHERNEHETDEREISKTQTHKKAKKDGAHKHGEDENEHDITDKKQVDGYDEHDEKTVAKAHSAAAARDAVQRKKLEESRAIAAERKAEAQEEAVLAREQSLAEVERRQEKKEEAARLKAEKEEAKRLKQERVAEKKRLAAEAKAEKARRKREKTQVELLAADVDTSGYKNIKPELGATGALVVGEIEKRGKRRKKAERAKDYKNITASDHDDTRTKIDESKSRERQSAIDDQVHIHLDGSEEPYESHEAARQVRLHAEEPNTGTRPGKGNKVDYADNDEAVDLIIEGVNLSQVGFSGDEATINHVREEIWAQEENVDEQPKRATRKSKQKDEKNEGLRASMYDDIRRAQAFDGKAENDYVAQVTDELLLDDDARIAQAKAAKAKRLKTKTRNGAKKDSKSSHITADMLDPSDWDDE